MRYIARMWPVDAVVGENGAFYFAYDRAARKMRSVFAKGEEERRLDRDRLETLRARFWRLCRGLALPLIRIIEWPILQSISARMWRRWMRRQWRALLTCLSRRVRPRRSARSMNGWFGTYDKLTMAERCLREVAGIDMTADNERIVFAGDSPNDAPMFGFFRHSVGVANVRRFELQHQPGWITQGESADGFCELANALVEARR